MKALTLIYTLVSNQEQAETLAETLIIERLAACVNIMPGVISVYMWQNKLHKGQEIALLIKTTQGKLQLAIDRLKHLHPYETPAILWGSDVYSLPEFATWAQAEVSNDTDTV